MRYRKIGDEKLKTTLKEPKYKQKQILQELNEN